MKRLVYMFVMLLIVFTSCGKVEIKQTEIPNDGKGDGTVAQSGYDIFLLIGQSNMAGRGTLLREDTISSIDGVFLLNGKDEPEPARCPLNKHSSIRKDYSVQQMNPGYAFSKKIYEKTGRKVLLVCNARGGTAMSSWLPESATSNYYDEAVRRTKEAMKYGEVKGILWHQGCGDSGQESLLSVYMGRLKLLAESLRSEFNNDNIYFVAGELAY